MTTEAGDFVAYRQEGRGEGIIDWGKHGDALVVAIQVELQSFALQSTTCHHTVISN